jgi:hypothetical protein
MAARPMRGRSMRASSAFLAGSVALSALAGCGRASGQPARYEGRLGRPAFDAEQVRIEPSRPPGYETLGTVKVRCRADDGVVALDGEPLGDVDCSDAFLQLALREKAASVGGEVLVGLRCVVTPERQGDLLGSALHTCSAKVVARARDSANGGPTDGDEIAALPPYDTPSVAFDVKVSLVPADPAASPRKAVPSDSVAELAVVPPGRVAMGDIVARCRDGCERSIVRHAVRAAAGRVGATEVVGIACVRRDEGWLCTGRATRPERDEVAVR